MLSRMSMVTAFLALAAAVTLVGPPAIAQSMSPNGLWDDPQFAPRSSPRNSAPQTGFGFSAFDYQGGGSYSSSQPVPLWTPVDPSQPMVADGGGRPNIQPVPPPRVSFSGPYAANSVVIDTSARRLYYVNDDATAFMYTISVGKEGFAWSGSETVSRIAWWPDWYPPAEMRQRRPELPEKMIGGVRNPLGAMAIYLGNSLYRIHGTDAPKTIGRAESSGCFRMLNENVVHLAARVTVGTQVLVVPQLDPSAVVAELPDSSPTVQPASSQRTYTNAPTGGDFATFWW